MAFLGKYKKEELRWLADEMGEKVTPEMKVIELKELITNSPKYDEVLLKIMLETIAEERKEKQEFEKEERKRRKELEFEERRRKEELEFEERRRKEEFEREERRRREELEFEERKRKEELEFEERKRKDEIEMKRLEMSSNPSRSSEAEGKSKPLKFDVQKIIPKFDSKINEISLYLTTFERQISVMQIPKEYWVTHLVSLLPSEIVTLIARESETEASDYDHVKALLLERFKLGAENFRLLFVRHQKGTEATWRDFYYEMRNYFEEWLSSLEINTFEELKDLMIADQMKRKVSNEIREHFIDEWSKIVNPMKLVEKLDEYEKVRLSFKKPGYAVHRDRLESKIKVFEGRQPPHFSDTGKPLKAWNNNKGNLKYQNQTPGFKQKVENSRDKFKPTCFTCGLEGHISRFCTKNNQKKVTGGSAQANQVQSTQTLQDQSDGGKKTNAEALTARITSCTNDPLQLQPNIDELEIVKVKCGDKILNGILDTGAQISVVRYDVVENTPGDGDGLINISTAFGAVEQTPLKIFPMKINDGFHGNVPITCAVSKKLVNELLLSASAFKALKGNIELYNTEKLWNNENNSIKKILTVCEAHEKELDDSTAESSTTLTVTSKKIEEIIETDEEASGTTFYKLQHEDESLEECFKWAKKKEKSYELDGKILLHCENVGGNKIKQVVLPHCKRSEVIKMAHDTPLAGHLGEKKTIQRIKYSFFWPTIKNDVKKYCESCKECQLRRPVTYRDRIPIRPLVRPETPFEVWSVDCIGPLEPPSGRGHKFVICAIDLCTRWAEAIPVRDISAKTTCNVLMKIFAQTGFPKIICSDQGTNFTSKLTAAFEELLGISPRFSTPGHPESMGSIERWNRTLKNMLNKNIQQHGRNWDIHLPYLLFAYREVPHTTTGVSPFQMVYGRVPAGPLSLLKEVWAGTRKIPTDVSRPVEKYLQELEDNLRKAHEIAREHAEIAQEDYTMRYNLRAKEKFFNVGDQVLVLIPSSTHKLLSTWIGPVTVVELTRPHSVKVEMEDGSLRELHVNKIRPFIARTNHVGIIFEQDEDFGDLYYTPRDQIDNSAEDLRNHIQQLEKLTLKQRDDLLEVLHEFTDVFSSKPGQAKVEGHSVKVTEDCRPKKLKPYRVPIALQEEVERQIQELLELDIIESSDSEWAHPVVCVAKKNVPNNIPWNLETEEAFTKLKEELIKLPTLYTPDLNKPFQLYTDASATAIGACLSQNNDQGKEMPIAFFSKKLNPCQMKWSTIEREAFCMLEALKKFDTWLFGAKIEIVSDHNPLVYLTKNLPHGAKLARWALALQRYNVTVTYRKGSRHGNADALSRLPSFNS